MPVVVLGATTSLDLVCIVEPYQARSVGCVQGQRIVQPVRLLRACRHGVGDKLDPVAMDVDHERLTVKLEKRVEG